MKENDDGTWRDEMVEVLRAFVRDALSLEARNEIELPHIVICRDPETGAASYTGPFPEAVAALVFAEQESERDRDFNPDGAMVFEVAALFPVECQASEEEC